MGRKHKLSQSLADLKIEKQVLDPNSVRSKNQSSWSSNVMQPPSLCHGSESCGCFCHYAQDDPPPCYNCCKDQAQSEDYCLAQKVLIGKRDSLSRGKSHHLKDYVIRDEFGFEIPKYRKKKNKNALKLSQVVDDESSKIAFGAKDSLRLNREFNFANHRVTVNNIFNGDSDLDRNLSLKEVERRVHLHHHLTSVNRRIPTQCRQQVGISKPHHVMRDNFGLEVRNSAHKGCTIS